MDQFKEIVTTITKLRSMKSFAYLGYAFLLGEINTSDLNWDRSHLIIEMIESSYYTTGIWGYRLNNQ